MTTRAALGEKWAVSRKLQVLGLGKIIQFVPYPVTTGFTSGIATVIATIQIKDFFGLKISQMPDSYIEKIATLFEARSTFSSPELAISLGTLFLLLAWPRVNRKIPAPLVALLAASFVTFFIKKVYPDLDISTIGTRFSYEANGSIFKGIPQSLPQVHWPWNFPDRDGQIFKLTWENLKALVPSAFAIAMLGAIGLRPST